MLVAAGAAIELDGTQLEVAANTHVTLLSLGGERAVIGGGGLSRLFEVGSGAELHLINIELRNGRADYGGGLRVAHSVVDGAPSCVLLHNSSLRNCSATADGGAVRVSSGGREAL